MPQGDAPNSGREEVKETMQYEEAIKVARRLSKLAGVSTVDVLFLYSSGSYAVVVDSTMTGKPVALPSEAVLLLWLHNHRRWRQGKGE